MFGWVSRRAFWHSRRSRATVSSVAPGGTIFITRGLIDLTHDEDELACVLAHEIAHVSNRDGLSAIQEANLMEGFKYLGESAAQATLDPEELQEVTDIFGDSIQDIVVTLVQNGYSREAEYAADRDGAKFAAAAGYDPRGLIAVLERMGAQTGSGGMFSTHPSGADRRGQIGAPPVYRGDSGGLALRAERFRMVLGR